MGYDEGRRMWGWAARSKGGGRGWVGWWAGWAELRVGGGQRVGWRAGGRDKEWVGWAPAAGVGPNAPLEHLLEHGPGLGPRLVQESEGGEGSDFGHPAPFPYREEGKYT